MVPDHRPVWFNKNAMTNVFSLAIMTNNYRVAFDSNKADAFIVHTPNGQIKLVKSPDIQSYQNPKLKTGTQLVETLKENKNYYAYQQLERTKQARKFMHTLGCPTVNDLKVIIKMNSIMKYPVTVQDIILAEKNMAKTLPASNARRPLQDMVEIPPELQNAQEEVDLRIDTMFINGMAFLTTISK